MTPTLKKLTEKNIALCKEKDFEGARVLVQNAEEDNVAYLFQFRADISKYEGNMDLAYCYMDEAIKAAPDEPTYLVGRSWAYNKEGRSKDSYNDAQRALAIGRRDNYLYYESVSLFFCAQSLFEMGRYYESINYALQLPDDFRWWVNRLHTKEELVQACQAHLAGRG